MMVTRGKSIDFTRNLLYNSRILLKIHVFYTYPGGICILHTSIGVAVTITEYPSKQQITRST
jgi:hypothetical protein